MLEEVLLVFGKICGHRPIELASERLVEGRGCDSKSQGLYQVVYKVKISHFMENGRELHKNLLWLDACAQSNCDFIENVFIQFSFLVVELLNELFHDLSEVVLVLAAEHADQIDLQLG